MPVKGDNIVMIHNSTHPYSTLNSYGTHKQVILVRQFMTNLSKFYLLTIFILADLLYKAVNPLMSSLPKCYCTVIIISVV